MPTPHKHAAVIKAWADGHQIQFRRDNSEVWRDCAGAPEWYTYNEYRIKPATSKYRLYLYKTCLGDYIVYSFPSVTQSTLGDVENMTGFIRWIGDWQEAEV